MSPQVGTPQADDPPLNPPMPSAEPVAVDKPYFSTAFAVVCGLIAVIGAVLVIRATDVLDDQLGMSDDVWTALKPEGQLASRLVVPIILLGIILVLLGTWMALVEWRGSFKSSGDMTARGAVDPAAIITAIGKLKGAALVLVVGGVLMLAAAWVASSAAQPAPTTPSPSSAATN